MSQPQPPQPSLKVTLKIGGGVSHRSNSPQPALSPAPLSASGIPKIKVVSRSQPPTPAEQNPPSLPVPSVTPARDFVAVAPLPKQITTKAGRKPKPSAKKRARADSSDDDDVPLANSTANGLGVKNKKIKIAVKSSGLGGLTKQPTLKLKPVGKIPTRPLGEGYDSEAEDCEIDPLIEEQLVLRMMPGEHCEYIRKMVQEKKIGIPKANGGADLSLRWLDEEGRRAMLTVQGQPYALALVDLPTITECMKTWDKKAMVKSADLCQMLLAFAKVQNEEEARTIPLPQTIEYGHRWPHGITPPMHDARNRRFRKRLSKLEIQNKEAEVERLLAADREALSVRIEWIDNKQTTEAEDGEEDQEEYEEDAEGEEDYEVQQMEDVFDEFNELDESALLEEFMQAPETPADTHDLAVPSAAIDAFTPVTANTGTPAAQTEEDEADDVDEEESDEDEEDGDEDGDGDDGDEGHDESAGVRAEIADLKKQLKTYEEQLAKSVQPIMRKRIEGSIRNVKSEIGLKMSSIGMVDED
ncbi:transcription initiation factor TFIID subunit 7 [Cladorrhinum sp. PSN259]|nr:transcription initiation factor TFIID subunit 7 [Cladorrhinum sp. PSN259]